MADEKETVTETPESVETPELEAAPAVAPDPQEERIDRIVAQRLGKYAARTREAENQVKEYAERLARLEGQASVLARPAQAPPPPQQTYTPQQLQELVDQGRITPALMADQIAYQRQQQGNQELLKTLAQQRRTEAAMGEVNQYITKMPALSQTTSAEFRKVAAAAHEIADEMGLPIQDARVQRRALRETFGSLDKLAEVGKAREFDRENADTHAASGSGGGRTEPRVKDKLAGIPPEQIAFWKAKNYSQKMMEDEAVFFRQRRARGG